MKPLKDFLIAVFNEPPTSDPGKTSEVENWVMVNLSYEDMCEWCSSQIKSTLQYQEANRYPREITTLILTPHGTSLLHTGPTMGSPYPSLTEMRILEDL